MLALNSICSDGSCSVSGSTEYSKWRTKLEVQSSKDDKQTNTNNSMYCQRYVYYAFEIRTGKGAVTVDDKSSIKTGHLHS